MANLPLYVDFDGTLTATDLLHESLLQLVRASPLSLLRLPMWLARGKAALKREVAQRTEIDVTTLPYRPEVLQLVRNARDSGRRTVLATASDAKFAQQVADHLGVFDSVLASDGVRNLSGAGKLAAIIADAGGRSFCYAGDRAADLAIWRGAEAAVVVSRSDALVRKVAQVTAVEAVIRPPAATLQRYFYGMRVHQWVKNLLIFLPLMPALDDLTAPLIRNSLLAFAAFSFMASGIYLINDLLDLPSDRRHHRKRLRPFAAGDIPVRHGMAMAAALCGASLAISFATLPLSFVGVLSFYMVLTIGYSVDLKRRAVVDVFALAGLYTIRVAAGTAATGLLLSFWILSFSLFIFLSLALAKRYVELTSSPGTVQQMGRDRGYFPTDSSFVLCAGVASGQMAVLLLSLYIQDHNTVAHYDNPMYLWILIPVFLFWTMRIWLKAIRGALDDDPVVFVARDWVSQLAAGLAVVTLWMAD